MTGEFALPQRGWGLTPTGLRIDDQLTFEAYEAIGRTLGHLHAAVSWATGDWLIVGLALFGENGIAQAVEATGRSKATLLEYLRIARVFPPSKRRETLSWSHHQAVASREEEEREHWLNEAERLHWSSEELRGVLQGPPMLGAPAPRGLGNDDLVKQRLNRLIGVARDLVNSAERCADGYGRVPLDALDRLARELVAPKREPDHDDVHVVLGARIVRVQGDPIEVTVEQPRVRGVLRSESAEPGPRSSEPPGARETGSGERA
jgi:hypothetical protein